MLSILVLKILYASTRRLRGVVVPHHLRQVAPVRALSGALLVVALDQLHQVSHPALADITIQFIIVGA